MDDPSRDHGDENALVKLASLVVLGVGLVALFTGQDWFWLVFALGFAVLVPIVKVVTDELGTAVDPAETTPGERRETPTERGRARRVDAPESKQDALDTLRDRYARGELDEAEFERKVERLLETETLEGAREHVARGTREASAGARDAGERGASERDVRDRDASDRDLEPGERAE